ncbi:MAG TPA: patatin-like phospholipase family protein [Deltaproteobacteria bacterium]|nr:patatin-like phospholipase family protein [Deltaproteobacteria bacterium]
MARKRKPTIGIALDSGGAMGGAHIGVLLVLAEQGVAPDIVVGSSAGAVIGAFFAAGRLEDFRKLVTDMSFIQSLGYYADPVFPYSGLLAGKRALRFIRSVVGDMRIEDLPIQFVAVATDLLSGETVALDRGPLAEAVLASMAIPGIFKPVVHMDRLLTDGGVSDPLPLDILKACSPDITVACNLHSRMPSRYSAAKRHTLVQAEQEACACEEDLAQGMIERVMGLINPGAIRTGIKPLAETILRKLASPRAGKILDAEYGKALKDYLLQGTQVLGELKPPALFAAKPQNRMNIVEILLSATNIQQYQKNRLMLKYDPPDVLIEPDVVDILALEFTKSAGAIEEGRVKALEAVPEILARVAKRGRTTSR